MFIIRGIGYRISLISKVNFISVEFPAVRYLLIRVGYSYSVYLRVPNYIGIKISKKDRKLTVYGFSKNQVAIFSHQLHDLRKPGIYTGRGIRFKGIAPRRKLGKKDIRKGRFF